MKKIFSLLLPLLILFLLFPNLGNAATSSYSLEELNNLILVETQAHQGDETIILTRGGSRGGGSRSFRSSPKSGGRSGWGSSKSKPKSTKTLNKNKKSISGSRNKKTPAKKSTVAKSKTPSRKLSKADKKVAAKARKAGKYHKDRKSARADFKKKNARKYTSTYKSRPATRPAHIPRTTMVNGSSMSIGYNVGFGGYGYMGPSGAWMMYNMMSDVIMCDMMMRRTGYVVASEHGTIVPIRGPGHYFMKLMCALIFIVLVYAIVYAIMKKSDST